MYKDVHSGGVGPDQIVLTPDELPAKWYNIVPDIPGGLPPPREPGDGEQRMQALQRRLVKECLRQETSTLRWIDIPEEVRELYIHAGRPRPLYRARRLEQRLGLRKVRIYYKREDLSPTGSHKVNTAIAQAYYAAKEGKDTLVTETGAGQWGTALSYAAALMGLKTVVFWVRAVYDWKTERKLLMQMYGARVFASPSDQTPFGRKLLAVDSRHPGSLGIAVSEGLEYTDLAEDRVYCLGSVLNHVLIHQSIIGLESIRQFEKVGDSPDLVVGCLGGGSNFGGVALPFLGEVLQGKRECEFLAAQSEAAPNLVKGEYRYDFGDTAGHTPLMMMYTLGHETSMTPIKSDGLRYHAAAPIISALKSKGYVRAVAYPSDELAVFEAAKMFLETEGWLIAGESAHAVRAAIDEAKKAESEGVEKCILANISGHGFLDIDAYRSKVKLD
ncbi:MAG: TrpB-like pyridoxal phosphate-dependent enzyme [Nitrososphaerota archaeon]|nr:TrpB-like pyridoxal phosphate-dependent enzyme [Nitrososphaerota archaeon]